MYPPAMEQEPVGMDGRTASHVALVLVLAAAASRVVPHPWNCTPVIGMALFGGAKFRRTWWAVLVMLASLALGDVVLGFFPYPGMLWVYGTISTLVLVGTLLKNRRGVVPPIVAALAGGFVFYLVTNFGVWAAGQLYPRTASGLVACYVAGLPFYGNQVVGDLAFTASLFGLYELAHRYRIRPHALAG